MKIFDEPAARQQWDRDPKLREEFDQQIELWLAYAKAEALGQVRLLAPGRGAGGMNHG